MRICPQCRLKYPEDQDRCFVDGAVLDTLPDQRIGQRIAGKYLVEARLGEGGMATVYRARHVLVDRPVAVKILADHVSAQPAMKERFRREAKNAAALAHPNIIEIYDHGETEDGAPFLVMELLEGYSLADLVARGPMPAPDVAALGLQIAEGLARAHDLDVVHRDLKPDNVFVSTAGGRSTVKLLDFGIARSLHDPRLTNAGEIFGTPQYMAPERITSIDAGESADLYALGVMLFEMLTGRLPFESDSLAGFFVKHLSETPPRPSSLVPDVPRRLEELILRLLAKRPEDRPVDAHQVIKELASLAPAGARAAAPPPVSGTHRALAATLPPTTLERWARRTALFEEMLRRAYPAGNAPPELVALFGEIRAGLVRVHELRSVGLVEQRRLDALDQEVRESRARLGHAVQSLAQDLSQAREAQRAAQSDVAPYLAAEKDAEATFGTARTALEALGPLAAVTVPSEALSNGLRAALEATDRWMVAHSTAERARHFLSERLAEVSDLEYQLRVLRVQLAQIDTDHQGKRDAAERGLVASTHEAEQREQSLIEQATRFCEALRPRPELGDLFQRLVTEST
ncbi:MAG: serine/threonine-protein kinase [Polyangiales bacterium]